MKSSKTWIRICNIVCSVLLLALLVFQFMPFWTMPACEGCDVRCELDVNDDCEACKINKGWCIVPTSCICTTKCTSKNTALKTCPICADSSKSWRQCVAESRVAEEVADDAEEAATEATEPVEVEVEEEVELVLKPIAPIPEDVAPVQVSMQKYIWMPTFDSCAGVTDYFKSVYGDSFRVNDIVLMPALTLILAVCGAFFGLFKSSKPWGYVLAFIAGLLATVTYLTQPIFQLGAGWQNHLYISIAMLVISAIPVVIGGLGLLRKLLNKKK